MPRWTNEEYQAYIARNVSAYLAKGGLKAENNRAIPATDGLRANHPKPDQGGALVGDVPREETCWHGAAQSFEITYTVYSRRPADWDNYSIKALQDLCCHAGILPTDKWSALSGRVRSRKAHTQAEERTEITIKTTNPHKNQLSTEGLKDDDV